MKTGNCRPYLRPTPRIFRKTRFDSPDAKLRKPGFIRRLDPVLPSDPSNQ